MQYKATANTPNKTAGVNTCEFLIFHHTGTEPNSGAGVFNGFQLDKGKESTSCPYTVDSNGDKYKIGQDTDILWHTGLSSWNGKTDNKNTMNSYALGIEVVGAKDAKNPGFTLVQFASVVELAKYLIKLHNIPREHVLTHKMIAPTRKVDIYDCFRKDRGYATWDAFVNSLYEPQIAPDVAADARYAEAVKWGITNKITNAGPTVPFNPDKPCTRAEVMQFLYNASKVK